MKQKVPRADLTTCIAHGLTITNSIKQCTVPAVCLQLGLGRVCGLGGARAGAGAQTQGVGVDGLSAAGIEHERCENMSVYMFMLLHEARKAHHQRLNQHNSRCSTVPGARDHA